MADPPSDPSSTAGRDDYYNDALENDRPLVCSNPSSYASSASYSAHSSSAATGSYGHDSYHHQQQHSPRRNSSRGRGQSSDSRYYDYEEEEEDVGRFERDERGSGGGERGSRSNDSGSGYYPMRPHINMRRMEDNHYHDDDEEYDNDEHLRHSNGTATTTSSELLHQAYSRRQSVGVKSTFSEYAAFYEENYHDPVDSVTVVSSNNYAEEGGGDSGSRALPYPLMSPGLTSSSGTGRMTRGGEASYTYPSYSSYPTQPPLQRSPLTMSSSNGGGGGGERDGNSIYSVYSTPSQRTQPPQRSVAAAVGGGGLQQVNGYWVADDGPLPAQDETRAVHHDDDEYHNHRDDRHRNHDDRYSDPDTNNNDQGVLVKYGDTGDTEDLTDDLSDFDCEEHYRKLPPPRVPPPTKKEDIDHSQRSRSPPKKQEEEECQIIVRKGLEPEEVLEPDVYSVIEVPEKNTQPKSRTSRDVVVRRDRSRNPRSRSRGRPSRSRSRGRPHNNNNRSRERGGNPNNSREIVPTTTAAKFENQLTIHEPPSQLVDISQKYNGYQHCFITIREEHRFLMLYTFLKRHVGEKIILFFSTTQSVQYYSRLLSRLKFHVRAIHSGQSKEQFLETFFQFSKEENDRYGTGEGSILCISDKQEHDVAIPPTTSWIVQFEPCNDPSEYIFRVGRISSEMKCQGRALLFLTPNQFGFLKYYKAAKVKCYEYEIPKIASVQSQLVRLIRKDSKLRRLGVEAYHAYLLAYASHEYRDIYNVHELDQRKVALCFGFDKPPSKNGGDDDNNNDFGEEKEPTQESIPRQRKKREDRRWKPVKTKNESWMTKEKSWRYANVHADKMKPKAKGKETDLDDYKPKTITMR